MRRNLLQGDRGQASPEWLGVVLVVSLTFAAMVAAGVKVPGVELVRGITSALTCAINIGAGCDEEASALVGAYGPETAELVAGHVPLLEYEEGMLVLPIDYRACRENACAEGAESGRVSETNVGEPVTLFSHVVDCRDPDAPSPPEARCDGDARGNLYLQYWAYYPQSNGSISSIQFQLSQAVFGTFEQPKVVPSASDLRHGTARNKRNAAEQAKGPRGCRPGPASCLREESRRA